ncbi:MAG: RNA methyltransferase [Saprospiraceae bacterium]|nr:RNA methyltransferase [Saprospiraceae bacterium]
MALSKNEIKYVKSLHLKKFRQKYNNFIVEGDKIVRELLASSNFQIEGLYADEKWLANHAARLPLSTAQVHSVSPTDLERISTLKTPNQVLVIVRQPTFRYTPDKINSSLSLYLDDIRDPGNFGTILRIADWFGIPYVFCSPTSAAWTNPKVIQASMGGFLRVQVHALALPEIPPLVPSLPVFGMVLGGQRLSEVPKPNAGLIVIGNESRGISVDNLQYLTQQITIPRHPQGGAESLNAAVATGIICAQWVME